MLLPLKTTLQLFSSLPAFQISSLHFVSPSGWAGRVNPQPNPSFPREKLQTFDAFELAGIGGDQGRTEAAGLGSNEKIERADALACSLQRGTDVGIMQSGLQVEVGQPEQAEKGF